MRVTTGGIRRPATTGGAQDKTDGSAAANSKPSCVSQARIDRAELSAQAVRYAQGRLRMIWGQNDKHSNEWRYGLTDTSGTDEATALFGELEENGKVMQRCNQIASRIMRGDKVPLKDLQYLMQHDANGYKIAMASRRPKKHPKECESVLKEGDLQQKNTADCQPTGTRGTVWTARKG